MIRVVIGQACLVKYRVPMFRELARRPGISLQVLYGKMPHIPNVEPDGFDAEEKNLQLLPGGAIWHMARLAAATRKRCDVLILPWDVHDVLLIPTLLRARANGVGTILWGHGYSKRNSMIRTTCRAMPVPLAHALLFYSHSVARRFAESHPRISDRIFVAPNALDQGPVQGAREYWLSRPDELAKFRRENDLRSPVVLFVSRLEPENRVELLLNAVASLKTKYPALQGVIVGAGPALKGLRALAKNLHLQDSVLFPGAMYDEISLAPWFLCSDVFCYPQNMGLSMLHAFGYGLPVVTSNKLEAHGPEIEALVSEYNGLLYQHENVQSLTHMLDVLFADTAYLQRLSRNAHETVTKQFTMDKMVDGIEKAIVFAANSRNP